ncbi:MAG TPA: HAD family hydrolase, partial [Thermopetrobacter sp.]|nr:HAD family hydrolase [Thermopetrobacter sp.]
MIERLRPGVSAERAKVVLFDFDGTISLIRSGWVNVMVPMMVEILMDLKTGESEEELTAVVREFVDRLTGKQTIYQMIALAEEVKKRGGTPKDPLEYK